MYFDLNSSRACGVTEKGSIRHLKVKQNAAIKYVYVWESSRKSYLRNHQMTLAIMLLE